MKSPEDKYWDDPGYRVLVDFIHCCMTQMKYTSSEVRDAAMLAATRYNREQSVLERQVKIEHGM